MLLAHLVEKKRVLWLEKQADVRGPGSGGAGVLLAANEFPWQRFAGMCACC